MPPKRKQANNDDPAPTASSSTRSTRSNVKSNTTTGAASSSKTNTKKPTTGRASTKANAVATSTPSTNDGNESDSDAMEVIPPTKKARTSKTSSAAKAATKQSGGKRGTRTEIDDAAPPTGKSVNVNRYPPLKPSNPTPAVHVAPTPTTSKPATKATKYEPFTPQSALELFSTYADEDDPTKISEDFERLCADASSPMEGPRPVILSWLLGAKNMGQISQEEWVASTTSLKISHVSQLALAINDLEELLLHGKAPIKAAKKDQDYDRTLYLSYESNPKAAFRSLYQFTFALAKPEQSRNIDMDTSVAFWTVLLVPKYPIMSEVLSFISEKPGSYRATNKDLWTMMLEFCETVKPTLEDYEADGAWPTLLDDFVLWKKSHAGNGNGVVDMDTNH